MKLIILSGPPAAGKNTIAAAYAKLRKKCAVIDVDAVRWMILQPHKAPWEGTSGKKQQLFGIQNTCMLAKSFLNQKYDLVILDVVSDQTAQIYRKELEKFDPKIILLLPTYKEIVRRNKLRPPWLNAKEIKRCYKEQELFHSYDLKIDNSDKEVGEIAKLLSSKLDVYVR